MGNESDKGVGFDVDPSLLPPDWDQIPEYMRPEVLQMLGLAPRSLMLS